MTPAGALLREEIARSGLVSFRRFMEVALYHPEHGYYRRGRDPFGAAGDYYTAEQLQPVFGILIARRLNMLFEQMESGGDRIVVELGAGRGEMAPAFSSFRYYPVDVSGGGWPERFAGIVFANEFFDALPVHVAARRAGRFRAMLVGVKEDRFVWVEGEPVSGEIEEYARRYAPPDGEDVILEICLDARRWIEEIARRLDRGFVVAIDYGYTARELARFPEGTLMSYRKHTACEDVLSDPGNGDITAHVNFTDLQDHAASLGLESVFLESMARTLIAAGEVDEFAEALRAETETERLQRRQQLKSLLYGMGETFRTLLLRKRPLEGGAARGKK